MVGLEINSFGKNYFERASGCRHVALGELLRHSDGLAKKSFGRSDISRVQLKSN